MARASSRLPPLGQVVGDARGAEAVAVHRGRQSRSPGPSPHHLEHDLPVHACTLEPGPCDIERLEQRRLRLVPEPCGVQVLTQVLHKPVVRGHLVLLATLLVQKEHALVVGDAVVLHSIAMTAPTRPKVQSIAPMSARSLGPPTLFVGIDASIVRASSSLSAGVLPTRTTCMGLWTEVAGLVWRNPTDTSQSKQRLMAERCCLTEALESGSCSTYAATWIGMTSPRPCNPRLSHQSMNRQTAR